MPRSASRAMNYWNRPNRKRDDAEDENSEADTETRREGKASGEGQRQAEAGRMT